LNGMLKRRCGKRRQLLSRVTIVEIAKGRPRVDRVKVIGWSDKAGMLGLLAFYAFHLQNLLRTRETAGLSLPAFSFLLVGCIAFTVLGAATGKVGLFVANGLATIVTAITLGFILWA
jgi:uncharacterized protein with PQ loop repeat